jgi:hypothetical protein
MKPNVGMVYPVAAPVSAYVPGTSITYGTGLVVDEARSATLNWERADGHFYGDDVELDSDNGILGYTLDFEPSGLKTAVRAKLLGEKEASTDVYRVTGANPPDLGFGYVRVMREDVEGAVATRYEGWWFHKIKFGQPNEEARTKERSIEWRTPTINGTGMGVFLATADEKPKFAVHETFTSLAAAKAWLNTKANISTSATT